MDEQRQDWTMYQTDDEGGAKLWQIRESFPTQLDSAALPTAVIVEWRYAETGLPTPDVLSELHRFEQLLRPLDADAGDSLLVHIIRGRGMSELCYYAKDAQGFIAQLNALLAGHPRFPISIEFMTDPQWEYRRSIAHNFAQ